MEVAAIEHSQRTQSIEIGKAQAPILQDDQLPLAQGVTFDL